jgi:hypothetical protein
MHQSMSVRVVQCLGHGRHERRRLRVRDTALCDAFREV